MRILTHFGLKEPFIFKVNITAGNTITLPLVNGYFYNCWVYWGDGKRNHITSYNDSGATHTYNNTGVYTIYVHNSCRAFTTLMSGYTSIRSKIIEIVQWGDLGLRTFDFYYCTNLATIPSGSITYMSKINQISGFYYRCSSLTDRIDSEWFLNCSTATQAEGLFGFSGLTGGEDGYIPLVLAPLINITSNGFWSAFQSMPNMSGFMIPADLHVTNTKVTSSAFRDEFNGTNFVGTIPAGLFRANSAVTGTDVFYQTFLSCDGLEEAESGLLNRGYHPNCTGYKGTFGGCNKLKMNRNIFFADGDKDTAFLNKSIDFSSFLSRSSFTGTQGEAPVLWDCDFGTGTPTKTGCFGGAGNSLTSLSNYADIPADWK